MIQMSKVSGESRERFGIIPEGGLAPLCNLVDSAGRLVVAGCYGNDLGGQIRLVKADLFESVRPLTTLPPGFMEGSELLHEIELGGSYAMQLMCHGQPSGVIVAEHIPTRWN